MGEYGHIHTHTGRTACEGEGKGQGDASISRGMAMSQAGDQKLGERGNVYKSSSSTSI